MIQNQKKMIG